MASPSKSPLLKRITCPNAFLIGVIRSKAMEELEQVPGERNLPRGIAFTGSRGVARGNEYLRGIGDKNDNAS